jgi:hypothetical protein
MAYLTLATRIGIGIVRVVAAKIVSAEYIFNPSKGVAEWESRTTSGVLPEAEKMIMT